MRRAVLNLTSPRELWRIPSDCVEAIRSAFGAGWEVEVIEAFASSDGDGSGASPDAVRAARGAEVFIGWGIPPAVVEAASDSLRWAHTAAAGVGASVTPALRRVGTVLTNSKGVYAEPMADWIIGAVAFCLLGWHSVVTAQREGRWAKAELAGRGSPVREFAGARLGLVGLGGVGGAVARRAVALGMEVRAIRRHPDWPIPPGVSWVGGPERVVALAAESDVLILVAPRTAQTDGLVSAAVLDALPSGAFLVNVGRGALVDETALHARLDDGRLGGCVLDVFRDEPLPAGHPFWTHPRVLVSPHVSGVSRRFWERETALIVDNIGRYLEGERLRNIVDLDAGY